ncbi:hypothetical protein BDN72DRAFT_747813, partial [Pluteus cervinus]
EKGVEPYMCLPIFPETNHPTGREPLRTNGLFPFHNCYTYGASPPTRVRVRSQERHYADAISLPLEEHGRDEMVATADAHRQDEL